MARWRLMTAHYLNLEDASEWEYTELDRTTGKQKKKKFAVPTHLDPNDSSDWNFREGPDNGYIAVTNGGTHDSRDIVFIGEPTPDMIPLDAEAEKLSEKFAKAGIWKTPNLDSNQTYSQVLVDKLEVELSKLQATQPKTEVAGMTELLTAISGMMKQNQDILNHVVGQGPSRRI